MIKKLLGWNKYYSNGINILLVFYKIFTYVLPIGVFAYFTFLHKVFSNNFTKVQKISSSALVGIVITALLIWWLVGKHFKRKLETIDVNIKELTTQALTTEDKEKEKSVANLKSENETLKKTRRNQAIYRNVNLIVPFLIMLVMVILIEKSIISMRGVLMLLVASMVIGFIFNFIAQLRIAKK